MHILVVEHDAQLVQASLIRRGNRREAIFYDDADRVEFLRTLGQACLKTGWLRIGSASYVSNLLSSVDSS